MGHQEIRIPPQNIEAEKSVLGSMLIDQDAIGAAVELLDEGWFYEDAHSKIYRAIVDLYQARKNVDLVTLADQLRSEPIRAVLGAAENQHLLPAIGTDQMGQQFTLAVFVDRVNDLLDRVNCGVATRDFNQRGRIQQAVGKLFDIVRKGGRKQQGLLLPGNQRQHLADIVNKTHIQHAVSFIEHQQFNFRQVNRPLADMIEQSAGGGYQNIDATNQLLLLRVDADTAEYHG